jgi:hypothetical protein
MPIVRVNKLFSQNEIDHIEEAIANSDISIHPELGRVQQSDIHHHFFPETTKKLTDLANSISGLPLKMSNAMSVEYSLLYGLPTLPAHVDGDKNDLIINIQLKSNTVWDMGLNLDTYRLDDNSALIFNANKEVHWRVHKEFKDGEYVRMLFVRFDNPENMSDYSYLPHHPDDEMFKEAKEFRDSLRGF